MEAGKDITDLVKINRSCIGAQHVVLRSRRPTGPAVPTGTGAQRSRMTGQRGRQRRQGRGGARGHRAHPDRGVIAAGSVLQVPRGKAELAHSLLMC